MKTIIAGSRTIKKYQIIEDTIDYLIKQCGWTISEVISGRAKGPDQLGENWSLKNNVLCTHFPAQWSKYGISAGHIRNKEMVLYAKEHNGQAIFFWDGVSKGTAGCIKLAQEYELKIFVKEVQNATTIKS